MDRDPRRRAPASCASTPSTLATCAPSCTRRRSRARTSPTAREPQARAARVGRGDLEARAAADVDALADLGRGAPRAAPRPTSGRPACAAPASQRGACSSVPSPRAAGSAAGRVADVLTTSRSPGPRNQGRSRNCACSIRPLARSATSSRTSSRSQAARLRRRGGLEGVGELEGERAHASTRARGRGRGSARSAGRRRAARGARGRSPRAAARSEMSSPGNASWCICVRMSPGSTA